MVYLKSLVRSLWSDESGMILSAEAALLGTVGVVGATVGLSSVAESVDEEMKDVAYALRSLDQSYYVPATGCECGKAWTAGSAFAQQPVEESHAELDDLIHRIESGETHVEEGESKLEAPSRDEAVAPKGEKRKKKRMENRKKRPQKKTDAAA